MRCVCNRFLTKSGVCNKCNVEYTLGLHGYFSNNGDQFVAVNHKLEPKPKEEKKMGFFQVNHKEAGGFDALPKGEYEAVITDVKMDTAKSGNEMIKITLTIRDDVEQEAQKRKLFDNLVITDNMMWKFQQVSKAAQLEDGVVVETPADFAKAIHYRAVRITVGQRVYNDQLQNEVKAYKEATVAYGGQGGQTKDPFATDGPPIDISDDDLPF